MKASLIPENLQNELSIDRSISYMSRYNIRIRRTPKSDGLVEGA